MRELELFHSCLETPAAAPDATRLHYSGKLAYETDPSDVNADLENGLRAFVLVDARSKADFDERHIPGAMNVPYRTISAETTKNLSKDKLVVVYCWGPGCNAATKAAVRLAALGFRVKEMIGGIEYWDREGYGVEGSKAQRKDA
ncbi:rhodanese-like domain-containing protein [Candidatus Bathyarchaeota archaeon]|nr:MAG: rhodanese-like domain-containing protein [Candidatus Bathyarchaeota archaeon]